MEMEVWLFPAELRIFSYDGDPKQVVAKELGSSQSTSLYVHIAASLGSTTKCSRHLPCPFRHYRQGVKKSLNLHTPRQHGSSARAESYTADSGLKYESHKRLNQMGNLNNKTNQWIKGQSGSLGNDAVNELSRTVSSMILLLSAFSF